MNANDISLGEGFVVAPLGPKNNSSEYSYFLGWSPQPYNAYSNACVDFFDFQMESTNPCVAYKFFKVFDSFQDFRKYFLEKFYRYRSYRSVSFEKLFGVGCSLIPESKFENKFRLIKNDIQKGLYSKAVLLDSLVGKKFHAQELRDMFWESLFQFLELSYKNELSSDSYFYTYLNSQTAMMGVSPEYLFVANQTHDGQATQIRSMALAGTQKTGSRSDEMFLNDPKEIYEHNLVAEEIHSRWSRNSDIQIAEDTRKTEVAKYGKLSHLKTLFRYQTNDDLSKKLSTKWVYDQHPSPALGIAPKSDFTLSILAKLNSEFESSYFGAPLGVFLKTENNTYASCWVQIRCLEFEFNKSGESSFAKLSTGCGVVGESLLQKEKQEIALKRKATLSRLGIL